MLEQELEYYESIKETLLKHYKGKFALIKGQELIGTFDTDRQVYTEGVERFGSEEFLARPITEEESVAKYPALTLGLLTDAHS